MSNYEKKLKVENKRKTINNINWKFFNNISWN